MTEPTQNIAWTALTEGTPVVARGGDEIGKVSTVVADEAKDIFSGIAFRHGILDSEHFIPADLVGSITPDAVHVNLDSNQARELDPYEA